MTNDIRDSGRSPSHGRRALLLSTLGGVASGIAPGALAQERIELKISHYLPPVHGIHTDFIEPWAKALEESTGGKVTTRVFPGNSPFGNIANQYDQVQAGVVDIAVGLHGIPRGRFPRTGIIDLPFLTRSADEATRILWTLYPKYLKDEYQGVKVLGLFAHNGGVIHTRERKVERIDDLKGLRIRSPSPAVNEMLSFLGATPVGMPPAQVYENLQKGVIDGVVFPWDPVKSFRLDELLRYHLEARSYTVSFYFVMNEKKYNALPPDVRAAIDKLSGDNLIPKFGPWWDKWDAAGLAAAKARGNTVTQLSDADRAQWRKTLAPMIEKELDKLAKDGIANAREIYAEMQRIAASTR
jgi:TRAP-type C4-dicarboxylate transport system substrate-binding protein